jgi:hypothetical protein
MECVEQNTHQSTHLYQVSSVINQTIKRDFDTVLLHKAVIIVCEKPIPPSFVQQQSHRATAGSWKHIHLATTGSMGDNDDRSSADPCESGNLVLRTEDNPLDCLQRFVRGLREGRRQKNMDHLSLYLTDYTQELAARVVDVFQCCVSKRIQWKTLFVDLSFCNQNRFLHLILPDARKLQQFKEVKLGCIWNRAALTNETTMELYAMMSSEQGLERLSLICMLRLLPGVLSTLSQGLLANRVGTPEFHDTTGIVMEREVMVDGGIMIDNEQNSEGGDGEITLFYRRASAEQVLEIPCPRIHLYFR